MIFLNADSLDFFGHVSFFSFLYQEDLGSGSAKKKKIPDPGLKNVTSGQTSIPNPAPEIGAQRWFPYPLMEVISDHDKKRFIEKTDINLTNLIYIFRAPMRDRMICFLPVLRK
jgi:hypothetical protein